ncbi:MAG TPA: 16S rRNA (adenine(1518)-N(6)/adenine(1519)-N(6))-dimethyltransferase RsmA [Firmicutes bacterium]|nr:16S rRNA (adenine(1518)-N(6)/adenine(1519)-N(6))-dimethyltransferase RsmA [Bacillota bacterium]
MTHYANPSFVQRLLREHGFRIKKSLGQNFLIDKNILEKIVAAAALGKRDWVLEIGPGLGALTSFAAEAAERIVALEIDSGLVRILQEILDKPNIEIVQGDALALEWEQLLAEKGWAGQPVKLVANLPYYLTTPLIMKALQGELPFTCLVVMVQKEVAERIVAAPGSKDYGVFSLAVQYFAEAEIVLEVPRTVFIPAPAVESAVVHLKPRPPLVAAKHEKLFAVIRAAFQQRRKTARNALTPLMKEWGIDRGELDRAFAQAGVDSSLRGEMLSLEEFSEVTKQLLKGV